jgi:hypothetical protein
MPVAVAEQLTDYSAQPTGEPLVERPVRPELTLVVGDVVAAGSVGVDFVPEGPIPAVREKHMPVYLQPKMHTEQGRVEYLPDYKPGS